MASDLVVTTGVAGSSGGSMVRVYLGGGGDGDDLTWGTSSSAFQDIRAAEVCDLDGDTGPDIVLADIRDAAPPQQQSCLIVLTNLGPNQSGHPIFHAAQPIDVGGATASGIEHDVRDLLCVDLDLNGVPDIVTANLRSNTVSIFRNLAKDQHGDYQVPESGFASHAVGAGPLEITTGRLNDDEYPDLVTADGDGPSVTLLVNDGTGSIEATTSYLVEEAPLSLSVADLNGDGFDDIATLHDGDVISILLNDADSPGAFYPARRILLPGADGLYEIPNRIVAANLRPTHSIDLISTYQAALLPPASPSARSGFRVTRNICACFDDCALPGDMNGDGLVDGDDIQCFVDCIITGETSNCERCDCADVVNDCVLDLDDVCCFVRLLLLGNCCIDECDTPSGAGGGGEGESAQGAPSGESGSSAAGATYPSSAPTTTSEEDAAMIDAALVWLDANPRSAYPQLTDAEYMELVYQMLVEIGLLSPDFQEDWP